MTAPSAVFELKVIIEADGWHDVAAAMASVDDALEAHRDIGDADRRWSVVANRLPDGQARELLWFVEQHEDGTDARAATDRLSA